MKMRAGVYHGYNVLKIEDWDLPQVPNGYALVQVSHCGISRMDVASFFGESPLVIPPRILGHEICGTVRDLIQTEGEGIALGAKVLVNPIISCGDCSQCLVGRSNYCENKKFIGLDVDGGFAEFVKVPARNLIALADQASVEHYVLAFPLGVAHHMVSCIDFEEVNHVLIIGCGPVGLLSGLIILKRENIRVDVIETNSFRLNIARNLGLFPIDGSRNQIQNVAKRRCLPGKDGPDVVIETSGNQSSLSLAAQLVRVKGQIIVSDSVPDTVSLNFMTLVEKELSLVGSSMYTQEDFHKSISDISRQDIEYGSLITHRLPLDGVVEGIRILKNVEETMKIVVRIGNEG
jgi:2-desacetyl-2-hydroxyethyl bacteriochlorophyllide A dehydrogenase